MLIREHYLNQIRPFIGTDVIKVITGMRRSGKSVILEQIRDTIQKDYPDCETIYLDFENRANVRYLKKDILHEELVQRINAAGERRVALFLDEIHDVEEWELQVNSLRKRKNVDIYITGSNSKLLSGELATYITGRYVEFHVAPFSFGEFKSVAGSIFGNLSNSELFDRYREIGGLPFLPQVNYARQAAQTYLEDLYWAILSKDVMRRLQIRDVDLLDRIVRFVMTECGHVFSAASIVRFIKHERRTTTVETVLNYLRVCEDAFLFSKVPREDLIGKRILSVDEKYYVTDTGLRRAVIGDLRGEDIDQVLENIVYSELIRRGYGVTIGRVRSQEVDFVCQKNSERLYVQVSYLMPDQTTREREFSSLESVPDQYDKLVLSLDTVNFARNGVKHHNLVEWLSSDGL